MKALELENRIKESEPFLKENLGTILSVVLSGIMGQYSGRLLSFFMAAPMNVPDGVGLNGVKCTDIGAIIKNSSLSKGNQCFWIQFFDWLTTLTAPIRAYKTPKGLKSPEYVQAINEVLKNLAYLNMYYRTQLVADDTTSLTAAQFWNIIFQSIKEGSLHFLARIGAEVGEKKIKVKSTDEFVNPFEKDLFFRKVEAVEFYTPAVGEEAEFAPNYALSQETFMSLFTKNCFTGKREVGQDENKGENKIKISPDTPLNKWIMPAVVSALIGAVTAKIFSGERRK